LISPAFIHKIVMSDVSPLFMQVLYQSKYILYKRSLQFER